ncbi:MAG: hypothetical protein EPN21_00055 [Methylococcaceae bacterium]|nr:MAG: hypothetical protein EPN21_00055 [Methylococcaceae bacterium]
MSKTFHVTLKKDPEKLIKQAKNLASKNGMVLEGDTRSGRFSGTGIEADYAVQGDKLSITVVKKPMIMPWLLIEKTITGFFS